MEKNHRWIEKIFIRLIIFIISLIFSNPSFAQINIISDEETELFLQKISGPLFRYAQIPFSVNTILIVNDNSLNAFVSDGNYLFINTGTIISSENDNEIQGVIAHEIGHIQGGHIMRGKLKAQSLTTATIVSIIMAGAATVASGRGDVGAAILMGSQSSVISNFLQYRVQEERSADEAAIKNLYNNKISPIGLRNFMKKIAQQNILSGVQESPYFRTHPVTQERISFIEEKIKESPYKENITKSKEFFRVKAKLVSFLNPPEVTFRLYKNDNIEDKYAKSIAYFKQMKIKQAIATLDDMIALEPSNPFFFELKGQIYLETGDVVNAQKEYIKALELLPNSINFKTNLSQTILENSPNNKDLESVVNMMNQVVLSRPSYDSYILLARAYGLLNKIDFATYCSAQASFALGQLDVAKKQAKKVFDETKNSALKIKSKDLLNKIDNYKN